MRMASIFIKLILTTIIFSLFIYVVQTRVCKKIYVAPIASEDFYYPCGSLKDFLFDCLSGGKKNTFVTTFDFVYNTSFTCFINLNENTNLCARQFGRNNIMTLNQSQYYGIKNFIDGEIEKDKECGENALIIFLAFLPCSELLLYSDLDELFGYGLKTTQEYLQEKNLHYLLVLLYEHKTELNSCNTHIVGLNFTQTSNIKTIRGSVSSFYKAGRELCRVKIPIFPPSPDTTYRNFFPATLIGVSIASFVILFFITLFIVFWVNQIRRRWEESKIEAFADAHTRSAKHIIFGKYKDEWEVTPKELKVDQSRVLGQGMFGKVYFGHLKKKRSGKLLELDVAVKFTHDHSDEKMRQDMIEEIGFMKALGSHENLLVMVGYVKSIENPVICTVFCSNGDLVKILQKHELHFMSSNPCCNVEICLLLPDLLRLAIEVCNGLIYLSYHSYVHRDIAARNVLLTGNMTAKLADFGLCKQLEMHDICIIDKNGKFPIKYMPYESLKFGEFSFKTDVWAYGILLFEMFSGGKKPFDEIPTDEFVHYLENDGKPLMPELAPQPIVQFLNDKVFQKYPSRRADFKEIKKELCKFHSIVCNVLMEEERRSISGRSSVRSSVKTN